MQRFRPLSPWAQAFIPLFPMHFLPSDSCMHLHPRTAWWCPSSRLPLFSRTACICESPSSDLESKERCLFPA